MLGAPVGCLPVPGRGVPIRAPSPGALDVCCGVGRKTS